MVSGPTGRAGANPPTPANLAADQRVYHFGLLSWVACAPTMALALIAIRRSSTRLAKAAAAATAVQGVFIAVMMLAAGASHPHL